ncbi:MAG: alpha/beta fold hydrolase [Clostridia bacterium]|nr:alpha/beta fold hydrolase [Clostridia bacterium]
MAVIRKEAYYSSSNGVNKVRALIWQDDEAAPLGVVQIAHGLSEHIGRYDDFARFLASNGFVVCGNDHLGHGKTSPSEAELGFVFDGDNVNMVRDMNTLHNIMAKRYPEIPYILFGHSMGSFLARIYTAAFGDRLSGAVYCGTGQLPVPVLMLEDPVKQLLDKLPENSGTPGSINAIFGKFTGRMFKDNDELAWLSRSTVNRNNYREDPLCGFALSSSLAKEVIILAVKASALNWASRLPKNLPILIVSGAKDPVGMFGRGVLAVSDALVKEGIEPEVILYPADRHEILNEDDNDKVYADILKFMKGIVDGTYCEN